MQTYTENFKKSLVKKVLIPGVNLQDVANKLNISPSTITRWKRTYGKELQLEVEKEFLDSIQPEEEEEIDIDQLIKEFERKDMPEKRLEQEQTIDKLLEKGKHPIEYTQQEKFLLIEKIRSLQDSELGVFCRKTGIKNQHIKLWEEELFKMAKNEINQSEKIKELEEENKKLQKQLKESEKEKKELKILIGLKKKYQNLFNEEEAN